MAMIRWEPISDLQALQNEMNRLFNTVADTPGTSGARATGSGAPARRWIPAMDLVETGDAYVLRADLPGLSEADIHLELEENMLTLSGERRAEHEAHEQGYHRLERGFGAFSRSLTLPQGVNPDAINATFNNGVLEVQIPKPEHHKPRKVAITAGDAAAPSKEIQGHHAPAASDGELVTA